jgi:hypothetical protein
MNAWLYIQAATLFLIIYLIIPLTYCFIFSPFQLNILNSQTQYCCFYIFKEFSFSVSFLAISTHLCKDQLPIAFFEYDSLTFLFGIPNLHGFWNCKLMINSLQCNRFSFLHLL